MFRQCKDVAYLSLRYLNVLEAVNPRLDDMHVRKRRMAARKFRDDMRELRDGVFHSHIYASRSV